MIFILLTIQLISAAAISFYIIKPASSILKRVACIFLTATLCWFLGIFLTVILTLQEAQSSYINISIGAGIWFALGGAIYGYKKAFLRLKSSSKQNYETNLYLIKPLIRLLAILQQFVITKHLENKLPKMIKEKKSALLIISYGYNILKLCKLNKELG